ncbi:MAG TPA: hypothetical protein VF411_07885, partial [Bacteroidia bacterium]
FATGIVASTLLLTGCSKAKDGAAGAAGVQGPSGVVTTYNDGFIKGTILGTERNGTTINEPFNFTSYFTGPAGTLDSSASGYSFQISRMSDVFGTNSANIGIFTTSPTSITGAASMNITFTKSLGNNKEFQFSTNGSPATTVSSLVYNASTKQYTGSFSMNCTAAETNTGKSAIVNGTFQTSITQLVYFNHHTTKGNVKE